VKRRVTIVPKDATSAWVDAGQPYQMGRAAVFEGEFDIEIEDLDNYVVVQTEKYSRLTYRDPSGKLKFGDRVLVPLGYKNREQLGRVIELGRGNYTGPTKDVSARLLTEKLVA
jgi:hypothetical protein